MSGNFVDSLLQIFLHLMVINQSLLKGQQKQQQQCQQQQQQ
jgi:hypothetical protein